MGEKSIYNQLKNRIILLEYTPGAVIREKELMGEFGVSRTPVREALMRLEMDGLVRIIPHVGTFVEDVSFRQLKDVFEIRHYLVRLSAQLAAERITDEEIGSIRERIEIMKTTQDNRVLMRLDREIHRIVNQAGKNEVLIKMLNKLHDKTIRIWTYSQARQGYWDDLVSEFEGIVVALARHDKEATGRLLENHTRRFMDNISSQLTF